MVNGQACPHSSRPYGPYDPHCPRLNFSFPCAAGTTGHAGICVRPPQISVEISFWMGTEREHRLKCERGATSTTFATSGLKPTWHLEFARKMPRVTGGREGADASQEREGGHAQASYCLLLGSPRAELTREGAARSVLVHSRKHFGLSLRPQGPPARHCQGREEEPAARSLLPAQALHENAWLCTCLQGKSLAWQPCWEVP